MKRLCTINPYVPIELVAYFLGDGKMDNWRVRVGDEEDRPVMMRKIVVFIICITSMERLTLGKMVTYLSPIIKTLEASEVSLLKESLKDMGRNATILCDLLNILSSGHIREHPITSSIPEETILCSPGIILGGTSSCEGEDLLNLRPIVRLIYSSVGEILISKEKHLFFICGGSQLVACHKLKKLNCVEYVMVCILDERGKPHYHHSSYSSYPITFSYTPSCICGRKICFIDCPTRLTI